MRFRYKYIIIITTLLIMLMGTKLQVTDSSKKSKTPWQMKQEKLDKIYSAKKLGSLVAEGKTIFRLFAPSAEKVILLTFEQPEQNYGKEYKMVKDENGVWETTIDGENYGLYYGYKVCHPETPCVEDIVCLDPYAKAVTTYNTYYNPRRAIVINEDAYDWEGDEWLKTDWRDLIIYEMHIRDMTAHQSSGASERGTYKGLVEKGRTGGIGYLKSLGINAVELLPSQEYANIEIPFKDSLNGKFNSWNPYERNHWGYMTAAFFAPESYYSENTDELEWDEWSGKNAKAVTDFKDMVKAFHKEGVAVIMDVVYNHISEYEIGNLKEIDKEYYFRLEADGSYIAKSGCGNDFKTERLMARRMIVESVLYWMNEYHIDGFRFDLGKLIDWETLELIIHEAKKINPHVIFVCEPWGGGYDPAGFSVRGWGSWNDQIRNGIKGENPFDGRGWIFGKWYGNNNPGRIKSYVNGTLVRDKFGLFQKPEHSVNYLESHDGYTLGDFIRFGLGYAKKEQIIENIDEFVKLTPDQLKLNKLAALFLFTSRGIIMIHSGQEYARSKVIHSGLSVNDPYKGMIDHNSYEKDNETNYINYQQALLNKNLLDYYKGLIQLRTTYKIFRNAAYDDVSFNDYKGKPFALQYSLATVTEEFNLIFNANPKSSLSVTMDTGEWEILVDENRAGTNPIRTISDSVVIPSSSGMVLKRK